MNSIINKTRRISSLFRYLTFHRILNLTLIFISYFKSFFGFYKLKNCDPYFISIESSNYCNLHCPECQVGIREKPLPGRTTFDFTHYKNIIDELKKTLIHVILYFQGEPFLNKKLYEMIRYAKKSNIYTSTSTNGQFLNNNNAREIVESGLNKLIISIDGYTQEVYETYRVGAKLEKTVEGIKLVVAWKEKLKSLTPLVEMQFLVLKTNEHQIKDMKKLAKLLKVDRMTFKTAQLYDFENGNILLPTKQKYARYQINKNGKYEIKSKLPNHCWRLWSGSVVNTNGEVLPCCFDKNSEHSYGNSMEKSFAENWHSKDATNFRKGILYNRKQNEICRNCTSK